MRGILLTGASGFLAGDLLNRLLASYPDTNIHLLLRAHDDQHLAKRRSEILTNNNLTGADAERVIAHAGNIEHEDLGLGSNYQVLLDQIDQIYHSAANTSFTQSLEAARKINFHGAENILRLATHLHNRGHLTRLHHISTAYVAGNRVGQVCEQDLDCGQGFFNTYEQSKFESEKSLQLASKELPITIYRPSIIVGDSKTGRSAHFYVIYEPMKWVYSGQLTFLPCKPELKLDIVPVDYVCDAIVAIGQQPDTIGKVYHLTAGPDRSIDLSELVERSITEFNRYNSEVGKPLVATPEIITPEKIEQFEGKMRERSTAFFDRAWQQMQRHMPYIVSEKIYDDSNTRAALSETSIRCPSFRDYMPAVVRYALERDFRS